MATGEIVPSDNQVIVENVVESATGAAVTLQQSILGSAVVLLIILLFVVLRMVFTHIKESDKRWSDAVKENTEALRKTAETNRDNGDKVAETIERAIMHVKRTSDQ